MQMLLDQKDQSERTNNQMQQLQRLVNSLLVPPTSHPVGNASVSVSVPQSNVLPTTMVSVSLPQINVPSTNSLPAYTYAQSGPATKLSYTQQVPTSFVSSSTTAPNVMANAAANLSAALQGGLGHNSNYGYNGLTIEHLRSNPAVSAQGSAQLAAAIGNVPALNPAAGLGQLPVVMNQVPGVLPQSSLNEQVISSVDQLFRATTMNKQLRSYEFASTGKFSYRSSLKEDNCNAITFAYGAFKHLHAVKSGLIKMSDNEFLARLKHLRNVFEVACLACQAL